MYIKDVNTIAKGRGGGVKYKTTRTMCCDIIMIDEVFSFSFSNQNLHLL